MSSLLNSGFILLASPIDNLKPNDVFIRTSKGVIERLNDGIQKFFKPVNSLPPKISAEMKFADTSGEEKLNRKIESHLKVLEGLAAILKVDIDAEFKKEKTETCTYKVTQPLHQTISIPDLAAYIYQNPLNTESGFTDRLKDDDIYVVTEIIKSKTFEVSFDKESNRNMTGNVTVPVAAEAGVSAGKSENNQRKLARNEEPPLVVAIKAIRIIYDKPSWFSKEKAKYRVEMNPKVDTARGPEDYETSPLKVEDGILI